MIEGCPATEVTRMRVKVLCSFTIEVEVPDDVGTNLRWLIEEEGCPATGIVGAALEAHQAECEKTGVCWACQLNGKNEIMEGV